MKKAFKLLILSVFTLALVLAQGAAAQAANVYVAIDGAVIDFPDQKPIIEAGRTMVPVRFIAEKLGAEVSIDFSNPLNQKVFINKGTSQIIATIGSKVFTVDGEAKTLETGPIIRSGRTLVPVRFCEYLGTTVEWLPASNAAMLYTKAPAEADRSQAIDKVNDTVSKQENYVDPAGYTVTTEKYGTPGQDYQVYRRGGGLPLDLGQCKVVKLEKAKYYSKYVLKIYVNQEPRGRMISYFPNHQLNCVSPVNVNTNSAFDLESDGTYSCEVYLGDIYNYKELGFSVDNERIYIISNPFKK